MVRESRKGNKDAFSELVRRYAQPVTMMILRLVRDEQEARDISQTVFMKAFEGIPRFMMASSFKTWLYRIAVNAVRDHLRRPRPVIDPYPEDQIVDPAPSPIDILEKLRFMDRMRSAIQELPEKQRLTLMLRVYEEMDYAQIARVLGGTAGSARVNFFQAVKNLSKKLKECDEGS